MKRTGVGKGGTPPDYEIGGHLEKKNTQGHSKATRERKKKKETAGPKSEAEESRTRAIADQSEKRSSRGGGLQQRQVGKKGWSDKKRCNWEKSIQSGGYGKKGDRWEKRGTKTVLNCLEQGGKVFPEETKKISIMRWKKKERYKQEGGGFRNRQFGSQTNQGKGTSN